MRRLVIDRGLEDRIEIESEGTAAYHVGEKPDVRSRSAAKRRGVDLGSRAQQFVASDFDRFDFVLAMDSENLMNLERLRPGGRPTTTLALLLDYDPDSPPNADVPDPYYGGERGFDNVLDLCEAACLGLLDTLFASDEQA